MGENEKACDHHKDHRRKILRRIFSAVLILLFLILLTILIIWAVLRPTKPAFILEDATIFVLNVTAPNIISVTLQVTVVAHNPNHRIGVYYDKISVFAAYHSQQITIYTVIPQVYQPQKGYNIWSPFLYANNVPIAPFNGIQLSSDQSSGRIPMVINLNTRVRWRVGLFISGRYHFHVTCPTIIPIGNSGGYGVIVEGSAIKYHLSQRCKVDV